MGTEIQHQHLLSEDWPGIAIFIFALMAVALWGATHWLSNRLQGFKIAWLPLFLIRCAIGTLALWLVCNGLNRVIVLATSWWIPGICIFCAIAVETILAFYHFERKFVSRKLGTALAALRVALVLTLGLMLLQPIFAWSFERVHERFIAILIDDSQSMHISDQQLTDSEKLQLVRVFDPTIAKPPYNLNSSVAELQPLPDRLSAAAQALEQLVIGDEQVLQSEFLVRRKSIDQAIADAQKVAAEQSQRIRDLLQTEVQLKNEIKQSAELQQKRLDSDVVSRLVESQQIIESSAQHIKPHLRILIDHLNGSSVALREVISDLPSVIDDADRSYYASLPPEKRQQADKVVAQTRADIARTLLLGDESQFQGLIKKIKEGYSVRVFRFNKNCSELDLKNWTEGKNEATDTSLTDVSLNETQAVKSGSAPAAAANGETSATRNETAVQASLTDIAGALELVQKEIPSENLAGVLLVTDGRHNAVGDVEAAARKLRSQDTPVSALVVGSSRPPVDAAIIDVEFPSTVLVDDLLSVKARVKVTGMKGRKVQAQLLEGDDVLQEKTISVSDDDFTTTLELAHAPKQEGFGKYVVKIAPLNADQTESEAFAQNNQRELSVAISDNRTEILIVEGRPRWEFGYLRNLFASRDVTVQLQTVLLEPDQLATSGNRPAVYASATRDAVETEATILPENEAEWLKFDVIVLGDVPLTAMTAEQQDILHKFVSKRGGTLIAIAGQRNMPHRFAGTKLADMLPIEFEPKNDVEFNSPEPEYEFRLSQIGQRHPIMRQADSAEASETIWRSMPKMYWRHAVTGVKPGAAVLAYASVPQIEEELKPPADETVEATEQRRLKRENYEKQNSLVVVQQFGLGRVMMMNMDRTWRFRYRVGDVYHHKFWGQVLRWATAEKLQAGTDYVQIGTERINYQPTESVVVTTKLTDSFFSPIDDKEATIKVYQGANLVITKLLEPVADNPGTFRVDLGKMPGYGQFRVELDSPEAKRIFAGTDEGPVSTQITVNKPETRSAEMLEPTADRAGLARLTSIGGGAVVEADSKNKVLDYFAEGTQRYIEPHSIRLWDTWPLLAFMVMFVTVEWIIRKKGGLV